MENFIQFIITVVATVLIWLLYVIYLEPTVQFYPKFFHFLRYLGVA